MRIHLLLICFLFTCFSCNTNDILSEEEIEYLNESEAHTVAIYIDYPPYEFVNENGEVKGILIDYFNTLENKIDHKFKKKFYTNWSTLMDDAIKKKVDIILEIQNTKERRKFLTFTKPIFIGRHVIVSKKNSSFTSIDSLNSRKIAVGKDYAIAEHLGQKYSNLNLMPLLNEKACIKAVNENKADAFIGLESTASYIITKEDYTELKIQSALKYNNELGIAINKDKPLLAEIIKKGNKEITIKEKNAILNKWLYNLVTPFHKKSSFWKMLLYISVGVLLLSFLFSILLKRQICIRTEALNNAKIKAENNNLLKTHIIQNISHEIRTPLNSIIGFTKFLKQNLPDEKSNHEYANIITNESDNLTNIIDDIIEISELNKNISAPNSQTIDLTSELNILLEKYAHKASVKRLGFNISHKIPDKNRYIITDKSRLIKSLSHVMGNAIKFTKKGTISFESFIENNHLNFVVTDTGIGITEDQVDYIFKEFYQEEKELAKKYDGLGIGLSITKRYVESLQGNVSYKKNTPNGSIFSIVIPINKSSKKAIKENTLVYNTPLKILIAEDTKLNFIVLEKNIDILIKEPYKITWAKDGNEAINCFKRSEFDLIFMDIKMPNLNGYKATEIIKKMNPTVPIIAQTAYAHENDINKGKTIGFDAYITKPIDSNQLKFILKNLYALDIK